jgi:3-oxoacyl-[acyl-carrier protein] reductase
MSDLLLDLNPSARKMIKSLGLPIPMPEPLRRASAPWCERPLEKQRILVALASGAQHAVVIANSLARAGAEPLLRGEIPSAFVDAGEAYGRPPQRADASSDARVHALVLDASGIASPSALREIYDVCHAWVGRLERCGRVVVLGSAPNATADARSAAAQEALDGFVRSLAKEVGRRGSTAQLLRIGSKATARVEAPLRWLLSPRSAFVSGQPLLVTARAKGPSSDKKRAISWVKPLDGKIALVTGAARGIGKATAKRLAEEGAHVVCLDRPADDGPVSQVARAIGGSVLLCDVSAPDAATIICDGLGERGVDIVVHNAGVTRDKTIARMKPELWDQTININLKAVVDITEALLDGPLHDHGRIVCLSSVAGIAGNMGQTNYAASKAGVIGLVRALAPKLTKRGITINAIAPGFIETRLTRAIPVVIREVGRRLSNLGQGGQPLDVAEAITFLASPGSVGLSGGVLRVCGGALIGA